MTRKKSVVLLVILCVVIAILTMAAVTPFTVGLYDYNPPLKNINLGMDLKGGAYALYEAVRPDDADADFDMDKAVDDAIKAIKERLAGKGYSEAITLKESNHQIRIEIPGDDKAEEVFKLAGQPAVLTFRAENTEDPEQKGDILIEGERVKNAAAGYDYSGNPVVAIEFDEKGTKEFEIVTSNAGATIYIWLDDEILTPITIPDKPITDGLATITGFSTIDNAQNLALQLLSGPLPIELKTISIRTVQPALGENSAVICMIVAFVGLALVIAFLTVHYGLFGVAGSISMVVYSLLMIFLLRYMPWVQLTLPGMAGIILGLAFAACGNAIIFERIRQDYAAGKSLMASVNNGITKSVTAILDSAVVVLIVCVALWVLGSASLQYFAMTLVLGIVCSVLSALLVTWLFVRRFLNINTNTSLYKLKRGEGVDVQ